MNWSRVSAFIERFFWGEFPTSPGQSDDKCIEFTPLPDEPLGLEVPDQSEIGIKPHAIRIAQLIAGIDPDRNFTIGVQAPWGRGKTTTLNFIQQSLEENPLSPGTLKCIYFQAWRFERDEDPLLALLATIYNQLKGISTFREITKHAKAFLSGFSSTVTAGTKTKKVAVSFNVKNYLESLKKIEESRPIRSTRTMERFSAFGDTAKRFRGKLVVFIDDLDRCLPSQAVQLLENIKLVLSEPGIVFVIAVNPDVVNQYVENRYYNEYGIKNFSLERYIDKLIQIPYELPLNRPNLKQLIKRQLQEVLTELQLDDSSLNELVSLICIGSEHNPRSAKRLINSLVAFLTVKGLRKDINGKIIETIAGVDTELDSKRLQNYFFQSCLTSLSRRIGHEITSSQIVRDLCLSMILKTRLDPTRVFVGSLELRDFLSLIDSKAPTNAIESLFHYESARNWLTSPETENSYSDTCLPVFLSDVVNPNDQALLYLGYLVHLYLNLYSGKEKLFIESEAEGNQERNEFDPDKCIDKLILVFESFYFFKDVRTIGSYLYDMIRSVFDELHGRFKTLDIRSSRSFLYKSLKERKILRICLGILKKIIITEPIEGVNIQSLMLYSAINRTLQFRIAINAQKLRTADLPPSTLKIANRLLEHGNGKGEFYTLDDISEALGREISGEDISSLQQIFQSGCNDRRDESGLLNNFEFVRHHFNLWRVNEKAKFIFLISMQLAELAHELNWHRDAGYFLGIAERLVKEDKYLAAVFGHELNILKQLLESDNQGGTESV